jgi:hypothetical protein
LLDAVRVGVLATATRLGSALLTWAVGFTAVRRHTRALLIAASLLIRKSSAHPTTTTCPIALLPVHPSQLTLLPGWRAVHGIKS